MTTTAPRPIRRYPPPKGQVHADTSLGWIRRLAPVVLAHKFTFLGTLVLALVANLLQVALPAILRAGIDQALTAGTAPLSRYVCMLIAVGLARAVFTLVYRHGLYRTAYQIDSDLRNRLYEHLTRLSFNYYDRVQSGQIISRANSDIRSVQLFLTFAPLMLMTIVMFVAAVVNMFTIHVPLTLVAIAPLPGVYWLGVKLRNDLFPLSWIVQGRQADVATIVDENIQGVRVIRSFAAERRQINELAKAATGLRWANTRTIDLRARYNPIIENLPRLGTLLVLVYGGWLVVEEQVTLGTLFAFTAYVTMLQVPFRTFGFFLMMGQRARASAARIFEVLDEPPLVFDRPDAAPLPSSLGAVEFDDVTFGYRTDTSPTAISAPILRHLSMRIDPGETVAIVGRTGSGKSTIARLLARFYDVDGGAIRVDGHDVRDVTLHSLRATIGSVTDEPFLFSVSLADNIAYARPDADRSEIEAAAAAAQADEFIADLPEGYDTVVGERGYTLSGGQRQRIAIARTLLAQPAVLVLDDATSAIDVHVEERIHRALAERLGKYTTIVIAHRLSTIALADRVMLLDEGRIVASGTHRELMVTEPRYAEVLAHLEGDFEGGLERDVAIRDGGEDR
ncbi:MAG: ABC transporter ATP-binding protein [Actinomycetota bacterium]|nr:ABC transporter ATP-binding protein [Actinomycetota bacterium]